MQAFQNNILNPDQWTPNHITSIMDFANSNPSIIHQMSSSLSDNSQNLSKITSNLNANGGFSHNYGASQVKLEANSVGGLPGEVPAIAQNFDLNQLKPFQFNGVTTGFQHQNVAHNLNSNPNPSPLPTASNQQNQNIRPEAPKFSRPSMRKNKLKRVYDPFRDRQDFSHITDLKERRRLRSKDNARLYRDKEKFRISQLENGVGYFTDMNAKLVKQNDDLQRAICILNSCLQSRMAQIVQQQQSQSHNQNQSQEGSQESSSELSNQKQSQPNDQESAKLQDYTFSAAPLEDTIDAEFSTINSTSTGEQNTLPEADPMTTQEINDYDNHYRATVHQPNIDRMMNQEPSSSDSNSNSNPNSTTVSKESRSKNLKDLTKSSGHSSKEGRNKLGLTLELTKNGEENENNSDSTIKNVSSKNQNQLGQYQRNESSIDSDYTQVFDYNQNPGTPGTPKGNITQSDASAYSIKNLTGISECATAYAHNNSNNNLANNTNNNTIDSISQSELMALEPRQNSTRVENSCHSLYNSICSSNDGLQNSGMMNRPSVEPNSAGYGSAEPSPMDPADLKHLQQQQVMGLNGQLGRKGYFQFEGNLQMN